MKRCQVKYCMILISLALGCLQSCTHAEEKPGGNYGSLDDFYNQNEAERIQEFEFNSSRDTVILAKYGAKIYLKAGVLTDGSNTPYEKAYLIFQEIRSIRDFVLANTPTQTEDKILETDGCFNIGFSIKDPSVIRYLHLDKVQIDWPSLTKADTAMQLFSGRPLTEISRVEGFVWEESKGDSLLVDDATNTYHLFPQSLNWINIDKFYKDTLGVRSNIMLSVPQGFEKNNFATYLIFHEIKSVLSAYGGSFENIPAGKKANIIAIGVKENKLYMANYELTTPNTAKTIDLDMKLTTKNEIKSVLGKF